MCGLWRKLYFLSRELVCSWSQGLWITQFINSCSSWNGRIWKSSPGLFLFSPVSILGRWNWSPTPESLSQAHRQTQTHTHTNLHLCTVVFNSEKSNLLSPSSIGLSFDFGLHAWWVMLWVEQKVPNVFSFFGLKRNALNVFWTSLTRQTRGESTQVSITSRWRT